MRYPIHAPSMVLAGALMLTPVASAQQSASFKLSEHTLNAGGNPSQGSVLSSASFRITLDAIGQMAPSRGLASASFLSDGGFVSTYTPPGEVANLRFEADDVTLTWNPEPAVGDYALYRDTLSMLPGLGSGGCWQHGTTSATTTDLTFPLSSQGFFYLVTARNRLREEGTKGFRSNGSERLNAAPCP